MGGSMMSTAIAAGAIAYARSLETRILALETSINSRISSLESDKNSICTTVKSFTELIRTDATGASNTNGMVSYKCI